MTPMGGDNMPPMGVDSEMEDGYPEPSDEYSNGNIDNDFDTNFDAGVEADEDTDPKKYIQQLTGKLSQTLNTYNNEQGEPDVELGKYVLGMLVKQGTKGMDEKDKKDIIKKINTGNSSEEEVSDEETSVDDTNIPEESTDNMQMESKTIRCTKKQIFESFGVAVDDDNTTTKKEVSDDKITPDTKRNLRTKPFQAPTKFKE